MRESGNRAIKFMSLIFFLGIFTVCAYAFLQTQPAYAGEIPRGWVKPDFYPDGFSDLGRIDDIRSTVIIIDDRLLRLSPYVRCHTPRWRDVPINRLKKGDYVGFDLDSEGRVITIWLIK